MRAVACEAIVLGGRIAAAIPTDWEGLFGVDTELGSPCAWWTTPTQPAGSVVTDTKSVQSRDVQP